MISWNESGLSIAAGSLTTLLPCVFPLLPLVLGGGVQRHRAAPLVSVVTKFAGLLVKLRDGHHMADWAK
jgi:cytochrome c biogenesis protein CcdA